MERGNQRDVKLPGSVVAVHYGGQHHLLFIRLRLAALANQHSDSEIEMAVIGPDDNLVGLYREHREKIDVGRAVCDQFCAHLSGGLNAEGLDHQIPAGQQPSDLRAPIVLYRVIAGITAYGGEGSEQRKPILDDDLGRE